MHKKQNEQGFHLWVIAVIVVVVAGLGFTGWYVWHKNKDDSNKTLETSQTTSDANGTVSSDVAVDTVTVTPTPTVAASQNELDKIRTYCQNAGTNVIVGSIQYVENSYGKFAMCGIGEAGGVGGGMLVAVYQNGNWSTVWEGNGVMDGSLCTEYKLPYSFNLDCPGWYE